MVPMHTTRDFSSNPLPPLPAASSLPSNPMKLADSSVPRSPRLESENQATGVDALEQSGESESPHWPGRGEEHIHPADRTRDRHSSHPEPSNTKGKSRPPANYSLFPKIAPPPPSPLNLSSLDLGQWPNIPTGPTGVSKDGPMGSSRRSSLLKRFQTRMARRPWSESVVGEVARKPRTHVMQPFAIAPGHKPQSLERARSRPGAPSIVPSSDLLGITPADYGAASEGTLEVMQSDFAATNTGVMHFGASDNFDDINAMRDELREMDSDLSRSTNDLLKAVIEAAESEQSYYSDDFGTLEPSVAEPAAGPSDVIANFIAMFPAAPTGSRREHHVAMPEQMDPDSENHDFISMIADRPTDSEEILQS